MADIKQILVIDDEKEISLIVTDVLGSEKDRRVLNASTPSEAYMRSITTHFDLIVTDFRMPKTDGVDLIKSIRTQKHNANTPVIFMSGFPQEVEAKVKHLQDVVVISKPFTLDDLSNLADKMLNLPKNRPAKKPQFDIQILNEFIKSTHTTITQLTGAQEIKTGKPYLQKKDEIIKSDITAMISVQTQTFSGYVALAFPEVTYLKLVSGMLKKDQMVIDNDNIKCAGAIVSLIYGQARAALTDLGTNLTEATPQIMTGQGHRLHVAENSVTLVVPSQAAIGDFSLLAIAN